MNILITSAGRRVSLVKAFQKEVQALLPGSKVFAADLNPTLSAACQVADQYFAVPPVSASSYIDQLLSLCKQHHIQLIIPTIDTELLVLAENKELFAKANIEVIVSGVEFVKTCRDKRLIHSFFEDKKIKAPAIFDKTNPSFPLFIKPYDGSLSKDTFTILSKEELLPYHLENPKLIFMELINRDTFEEYTVDMYYGKDNRVKCIVPRKRIEVRGGEINKGLTVKNHIVKYLLEKLESIRSAVGCLTLQLFYNKSTQEIIAIEINPRFGGGFPLSYLAGGNFPAWLIREYLLNEKINYTDTWEENLLMLRYDDEVLVHGFKNG